MSNKTFTQLNFYDKNSTLIPVYVYFYASCNTNYLLLLCNSNHLFPSMLTILEQKRKRAQTKYQHATYIVLKNAKPKQKQIKSFEKMLTPSQIINQSKRKKKILTFLHFNFWWRNESRI